MKKNCNIRILAIAVLIYSFFSCSDEGFELDKSICEVTISGLQQNVKSKSSSLKVSGVDRGAAPSEVDGYTLKVENLDYSLIETIQEDFQFEDGWFMSYGNGVVEDVTEGLNRFTAESYGGTTYKGWKKISRAEYGSNDDEIADEYSYLINEKFSRYTVFRDVVEMKIYPNQNNEVRFNMKPVNGRLAIVVENNKRDHKLLFYVNGAKRQVRYGKNACYLLNDNSPDGTELDVKIVIKKKRETVKTIDRTYTLKAGKDRTRFINVE